MHDEDLGAEFLAGMVMAGNTASNGFVGGHKFVSVDADVSFGADAPVTELVAEIEPGAVDGDDVVDGRGEVVAGSAAHSTEEDIGEPAVLIFGGVLIDVEADLPRRSRLVVVVEAGHDNVKSGENEVVGLTVADMPGEYELADAFGGSAAGPTAHGSAWADRFAVARFEVGAADGPRLVDHGPTLVRTVLRVPDNFSVHVCIAGDETKPLI